MVNLREKEIIKILKELRERTNILCSTVFTEDGFIVAVEQAQIDEDDDYHQSIGAICASIVSLAENGIELFQPDKEIRQISIQAGDQLDNEGFTIVLESITDDTKLSVVFPTFLNLGVILFEIKQTIQKLYKYFSRLGQNENLEGISSSPKIIKSV